MAVEMTGASAASAPAVGTGAAAAPSSALTPLGDKLTSNALKGAASEWVRARAERGGAAAETVVVAGVAVGVGTGVTHDDDEDEEVEEEAVEGREAARSWSTEAGRAGAAATTGWRACC